MISIRMIETELLLTSKLKMFVLVAITNLFLFVLVVTEYFEELQLLAIMVFISVFAMDNFIRPFFFLTKLRSEIFHFLDVIAIRQQYTIHHLNIEPSFAIFIQHFF